MRTRFIPIFSPYPKILARMRHHVDNALWRPTAPVWRRTTDDEGEDQGSRISGSDRWALARVLELFILNNRGRDVRCHFLQLDPEPVLRVAAADAPLLWWLGLAD